MTDQEATEKLAAGILMELTDSERRQVFSCKRELEKVLRKYGPLGTLAYGVLAAELQSGRKPGEVTIEQPAEAVAAPVTEQQTVKCNSCGEPATRLDRDDIPVCDTCFQVPDE